jgi:ubiquinone/menaquinone biosynthesis C-methylase UbiE
MIDQNQLDRASRFALNKGVKLLQGYRLADTAVGHIQRLMYYMAPGSGTRWLDVGSGFGEAARLMRQLRPDLKFTLLNNNKFQLSHTPRELCGVHGDMHRLPFADADFDGVMFLYSLCHADDLAQVLAEAHRVTRPGGALFIYDYARTGGDNDLTEKHLNSYFWTYAEFYRIATETGWKVAMFRLVQLETQGSDAVFREMAENDVLYDTLMGGLEPVIWKGRRDV